jgi:tRNA-2-methylthio-N6-dimethylallyladenosine synthase
MKYYFWILGCAMNYSDAERISAVLDSLGYTKTESEKDADLFIIISCSVRQSAINRIYGKVRDLKEIKAEKSNFKTMLTGCVLEKDRKKLEKVFDIMLEIDKLDKLPELLDFKNKGLSGEYLSIQPHYSSNFRAYVPISVGCDNFCSYCAVPYTRGREKSRPVSEIIAEVTDLIEKGYKEITLLGQNVNSYGVRDTKDQKNIEFIELLQQVDQIPGDYRVYFYSNHPKDMSDELVKILLTLKHFPRYIHLPLQSGNDEIIRRMNRHYTKKQYLELVVKIRKAMPDVTLTTDIIVGYPGETEEQFQDTTNIMRKVEYDMAFIAQYSPRPGTVSARQPDDVTKEEKIRRERVLQGVLAETVLRHNKQLVGTIQKVLIDEQKNDKFFGRTEGFKVVEIKTDQPFEIGQFVKIKIDSATSWKLVGTIRPVI